MNRIVPIILIVFVIFTISKGEETMLTKGTKAPDFSLLSSGGDTVSLDKYRGAKNVVLIFYPGDETPGCTKQLCEIRDDYSKFEANNTVVFGVNGASAASHKRFIDNHTLPFPLLIDTDNRVAALYGAKGLIMSKRTVYFIDTEGVVQFAERGKPSVATILEAVKP